MAARKIRNKKEIASFKDFHRLVPQIIEQITNDDALSVRAAANPILAIEELGYKLVPEVQEHVELLLRFPPESRKKIKELEKDIHKIAGEKFDISNVKELNRVLYEKLKLDKSGHGVSLAVEDIVKKGYDLVKGKPGQWSDPLQKKAKAHKIIKPLLEYRRLMAEHPGFAPVELYEQLKTGRRKLPVSRIRIDLPEHTGEYGDA